MLKWDIKNCKIFIVTVPTICRSISNKPDLSLLKKSCHTIAPFLKKTTLLYSNLLVYPGATEEVCVPILEKNQIY